MFTYRCVERFCDARLFLFSSHLLRYLAVHSSVSGGNLFRPWALGRQSCLFISRGKAALMVHVLIGIDGAGISGAVSDDAHSITFSRDTGTMTAIVAGSVSMSIAAELSDP